MYHLNQHRTFGGIERAPMFDRPTQAQYENLRQTTARRPTHVVAFVNRLSGGMTGQRILEAMAECFGKNEHFTGEVCDLSKHDEPESTIRRLSDNLTETSLKRLLVCGGDGTVTWILTALEQCKELHGKLHLLP
eukprot:6238815-Amphidinium_carterae.1